MKNTLTKLAGAGVLALAATASAFAASVTQPGETVGVAAGAPLPPGFYFIDTTDWGVRDTPAGKVAVGVTIPVLAWSTPWKVLGARLQFLVATPAVEVGTEHTGPYNDGMYNPYFAAQLAWDLGRGWGFSYALGTYIGVKTPVGFDSTSLNQRFALSYTGNGWDLTANLIWGVESQAVTTTINPDFINLDLTATKKFGKWEVGAVGFYSTDVSDPVPGYKRLSQFALGGLVGYNFGPVILQAYLTRDVYQQNYGGYDTRVWSRVIIPLGDPFAPAPSMMYHK
jgi:Putative MetA-pathway of phenol degradation